MSRLDTPDYPAARIGVFLGPQGSGKTFRARERWWAFPRGIAIDVKHLDGSGDFPGLVATRPRELAKLIEHYWDAERFRIVYRGQMDPDIWDALGKIPNYHLCVDETDKHVSASWCPDGMYNIAHHGRTEGQALTLCGRRPANITRDLTALADELWTWPMDEPNDLKHLKARGFQEEWWDDLPQYAAIVRIREQGKRGKWFRIDP